MRASNSACPMLFLMSPTSACDTDLINK
jgi:hypothetical protein